MKVKLQCPCGKKQTIDIADFSLEQEEAEKHGWFWPDGGTNSVYQCVWLRPRCQEDCSGPGDVENYLRFCGGGKRHVPCSGKCVYCK